MRAIIFFCCCLGYAGLQGQGAPLPVGEEGYDLLRRLQIRFGHEGFSAPAFDLNLQTASRGDLVRLAKTYYRQYENELSTTDRYRLRGFFDENNEWLSLPALDNDSDADRAPFWLGEGFANLAFDSPLYRQSERPVLQKFYRTPAHLIEHNQTDFYLRFNPLLDFRYGKQKNDPNDYFFNRRGLKLRAGFDDRIFLYFEILETQVGSPNYVRQLRERFGSLPGAGLLKSYSLDVANVENGYDYLNGQGFLSADITRHVGVRLGYGQHFIGAGERSLLLSDFSNNYPFLEVNWRIWKFHYRNLFAELTSGPQGTTGVSGIPLRKKYLAAHYLSLNLGKRLSLGLFEAVILNRENGFDLAYLNPIILYRTVEGSVGSPDNVLIGLTADYRLPFRTQLYGQFILDEFKFDELFVERRGWWANKWAYQIGARHVDAFGVNQLDLVVERNVARPYIFSHRGASNYTHFALPLAHPLGANFKENLVGFDYRPLPRLNFSGRLYLIEQGEGLDGENVGENLNLSSDERTADFGNEIGQGTNYTNTLLQLRAGYELKPNLWLEADFLSRNKDSELNGRDLETTIVNAGVRWNVARRREAF